MEAERQRERDVYYMALADSVRARANCLGSEVGAVLVLNNRVIGTGYNGTPADFDNCRDGGCLRCSEHFKKREAEKAAEGAAYDSPHPETVAGKALDVCFCVHAEQNALLSGARHGIPVADATLYTTHQPCFSCLKESIQAGVTRIVYLVPWYGAKDQALRDQYDRLTDLLTPVKGGDAFHRLAPELYDEFRKEMPTALEDLEPDTPPDPAMGSGA